MGEAAALKNPPTPKSLYTRRTNEQILVIHNSGGKTGEINLGLNVSVKITQILSAITKKKTFVFATIRRIRIINQLLLLFFNDE